MKKILLGVGCLILLALAGGLASIPINGMSEPPKIVVNFMDMKKVRQISKYRSCYGHTVVPQDMREMKRNMKHYVEVYPEFKKEEIVEIYAPYDGYISVIREDMRGLLEGEIWVAPDRGILSALPPLNLWMFSVEHVRPRAGLRMGQKVRAGEIIGYASFLVKERVEPTFDVIYGKMGLPPKRIDNWTSPFSDLDSIFNHMSDEVLGEYRQRGISKENIILSKEERDAKPCVYREAPYFENSRDVDNWVVLK